MVCAGKIWCPSILRALYRGSVARPHRWKFLLNAPATFIESITGEAYDVEGIHDCPCIGGSSAAALLNPVNASIATTSIRSHHVSGREARQALKTCLERPITMSKSREGPLRSRMGVKSKITVTNLSPYGVCRHTCSSTPMTRTPSNRVGSLMSARWPSVRTAVLAALPGHA